MGKHIQRILQKNDAAYEANQSESQNRNLPSQFDEIDKAVYQWYRLGKQRQVLVTGPMLQEEALKIAEAIGNEVFKAPNRWLEQFKYRHNLKQFVISGEAASVSIATVAGWLERMKELTREYNKEDVWNVDESGCFFRALPDIAKVVKKLSNGLQFCLLLMLLEEKKLLYYLVKQPVRDALKD